MKKRILFTTIVLGLLTFLVYVLIVGAVDYFITNSGSNYYGNIIWETTLNGTAASDEFGWSVASGDVNNDSYVDIIVGADKADASGVGGDDNGQVFVFFGSADGIPDMDAMYANITINGTATYDYVGWSVATGDINNDSYADIIVGASSGSPPGQDYAGQVFVFFGADYTTTINENAMNIANITLNGTVAYDYFGWSVASGDVNNDSYADIIVGASMADTPTAAGQVFVFFGAAYDDGSAVNGFPGPAGTHAQNYANITLNGTKASDQFGRDHSVAAGDVNNDSYADILVGARQADPSDVGNAGQAYVFFGGDYSNAAPGAVSYNALIDANISINGTAINGYFYSVASGDVNNDDYKDMIAGAYGAGQAFVFFGADFGTTAINENDSTYANITFNGTVGADFGWSVGSGDVDNDSYADIIIGGDMGATNFAGQVTIYAYDVVYPVVTLDAPTDNGYDVDGDVNFSFTSVEVHPDLCNLWLRGNVTNWAQNDSTTYSNNVQANIFVNLTDAVYVWTVYCNDTANNYNNTIENRTLTVDTTAPITPILTAPSDTSINPRDSISYTCESSDATAGISRWTWTLNKPQSGGTVTKTGGEVASNSQTFSGDETNLAGTYTVICEVEDKAGHKSSTSSTFSVFFSHAPEGGGGGVGPSAAAQLDFTVQDELKIKEPQGAIMTFTLDGTAFHTIKLKEVTTKTVTVVIEPRSVKVTLDVGGTKEVDADGDGINDIGITLENIENGFAQIMIKKLPLPKEVEPVEEIVSEEVPEEVMPEEARVMVWPYILAGLVLALIISYLLLKKKK